MVFWLAGSAWSLPQTGTNLCGTNERGFARQAGDTWQEECNRCRCTDNLLPGCTKRFCGPFPDKSPAPEGGEASSVGSAPQTRTNLCGSDERGVARKAGDTWQEECNRCRCTDNLIPGCTERLCAPFPDKSPAVNLCGSDERGVARKAGDIWQEECNRCRCTEDLRPGCTKLICGAFPEKSSTVAPRGGKGGEGGVKFPGVVRGEPVQVPHCTDQSGQRREVGESWKEECNNCRCATTGISLCTHRFCIDVETFRKGQYLFTVDSSRNTEDITQCQADGARNCKAVTLDASQLSSSRDSSQFLHLLPGSQVELQVLRRPEDLSGQTLNYQFSLTDGGSGSLTYRPSTSAVYGSFKPISGSVHYELQSCGDGCNVIYERDSNYFNQFED